VTRPRAAPARRSRPGSPRRRLARRLRRAGAWLAATALPALVLAYLRLVWRTSRVEDAGLGRAGALAAEHGCAIALVWHEQALVAPMACRALGLRPATLVSRSDAGEVAARLLERQGFRALRGGSSRRASRHRPLALRALLRHAEREPGALLALAVDGSHGPARRVKPGAAWLASAHGHPVLLAHVACRFGVRLPTWDGLVLPLPFNRIRLALAGPLRAPPGAARGEARERWRAELEAGLARLARASAPA